MDTKQLLASLKVGDRVQAQHVNDSPDHWGVAVLTGIIGNDDLCRFENLPTPTVFYYYTDGTPKGKQCFKIKPLE
jgi:hypothetical protein